MDCRQHIKSVIHLGDIADNAKDPKQWQLVEKARTAMEDAGLDVAYTAGNHNLAGRQLNRSLYFSLDDQRNQEEELYLKFVQSGKSIPPFFKMN